MFNMKIRRENVLFWVQFVIACFAPALAYYALEPSDLSTWDGLAQFLMNILNNPYLIIITIVNALNIIPDNTTPSLGDSSRVLNKRTLKD